MFLFIFFFFLLTTPGGLVKLARAQRENLMPGDVTSMLPKKLRKKRLWADVYPPTLLPCHFRLSWWYLSPSMFSLVWSINRLFVSITKPPPLPPPPRPALSVIGWDEETTDTSDLFSDIVASQFLKYGLWTFKLYSGHIPTLPNHFSSLVIGHYVHCLGQLTNNRSFRNGNQLPLAVRS